MGGKTNWGSREPRCKTSAFLVDDTMRKKDCVAILKNNLGRRSVEITNGDGRGKPLLGELDVLDFLKQSEKEKREVRRAEPSCSMKMRRRPSSAAETNQTLSDSIISHVSGALDASPDHCFTKNNA
jgi:hypothetical protein